MSDQSQQPQCRDGDGIFYEVEEILDYKLVRGYDWYLIKWVNYPIEQSTWEPYYNLKHLKSELLAFKNQHKKTKRSKPRAANKTKVIKKTIKNTDKISPQKDKERSKISPNNQVLEIHSMSGKESQTKQTQICQVIEIEDNNCVLLVEKQVKEMNYNKAKLLYSDSISRFLEHELMQLLIKQH